MNITRENLSDLDLCIKVEIEENDYIEKVNKELKRYQRQATLPGFRKGMAPMALVQRHYKSALVADTVQELLNAELFKYIDSEKLNIMGLPMSNDEKTPKADFDHQTSFEFYFDAALMPEYNIQWDKIDVKYNQIKVTAKDVDHSLEQLTNRYGRFETPETVGKGDIIYGRIEELGKDGQPKEGGVQTFTSLNLLNLKDEALLPTFEGKKNEEVVEFNMAKAFSAADIERALRIDNATAKKFKSDVRFTISGISRILPHEIDEDLFSKAFPGKEIKDLDAFRKAIHAEIEEANNEQSDYFFINQMREALVAQFDAPLPEAFLKRYFASRNESNTTLDEIEAKWQSDYLPSLKWEIIETKLEAIQPVEPTSNQLVDYVKEIIGRNDQLQDGETEEQRNDRLEKAARSIVADRNNVAEVRQRLYAQNLASVLKSQYKPTVEKISSKEFTERVNQSNEAAKEQ